jgi:hypothetical protein
MDTKFWEVVCDENDIGGDGEYCGGNDSLLECVNVLYHEAKCGKYVPRAVFFDLESGVINAVRASPLGELFRLGNLVNQNAGAGRKLAKAHYTKTWHEFCLISLLRSDFYSKLRAPHRGKFFGSCVCGARAGSLCSLAPHTSGPRDVPRCGALS